MSKEKKKEPSKYDEKLKIEGTLDDVLRVSVDKKKKANKKPKKD